MHADWNGVYENRKVFGTGNYKKDRGKVENNRSGDISDVVQSDGTDPSG